MSTYRITLLEGRYADRPSSPVPGQLCCEQCQDALHEFYSVDPRFRKLAGMTATGVANVWPVLAATVREHDTTCPSRRG